MEGDQTKKKRVSSHILMAFVFICNFSLAVLESPDGQLVLLWFTGRPQYKVSLIYYLSLFNVPGLGINAGQFVLLDALKEYTSGVLTMQFQARLVINRCKLSVWMVVSGR